jgi:hypothetical protein
VKQLLENSSIPDSSKIDIVIVAAKYEYNLIKGRREIIHLEGFVTGIMMVLHKDENYTPKKMNLKYLKNM